MAEKDFTVTENQDRGKSTTGQEEKGVASSATDLLKPEKPEKLTDVKNAHATGDGSFGRSESSLPEKEEQEKPAENPY